MAGVFYLLLVSVAYCFAASGSANLYSGSASGSSDVSSYSAVSSSGSYTTSTNNVAINIRGIAYVALFATVSSNNCGIPYSSATLQIYDSANSVVVGTYVLPSSGSLSQTSVAILQSNSVIKVRLVLTGSCSASVTGVSLGLSTPVSV